MQITKAGAKQQGGYCGSIRWRLIIYKNGFSAFADNFPSPARLPPRTTARTKVKDWTNNGQHMVKLPSKLHVCVGSVVHILYTLTMLFEMPVKTRVRKWLISSPPLPRPQLLIFWSRPSVSAPKDRRDKCRDGR